MQQKNYLFIVCFALCLINITEAFSQINKEAFCRSWVMSSYDYNKGLAFYKPYSEKIHDSSKTYTVITFQTDGAVAEYTHRNAYDLAEYKMKPCGNGDSRIFKNTWSITDSTLTWYTNTEIIGGMSQGYESTVTYKVVELKNKRLTLKYIDSKRKEWSAH